MRPQFLTKIDAWIDRKLYYPGDDAETLALKKRFWRRNAPGNFLIAITGIVIWLFGLKEIAISWWIYAGIGSCLLGVFFRIRQKVEWFAFATQYFAVFTSFVVVLYFGGILHSGGMVFVGLSGALNALAFFKPRQFRIIFYVYAGTVILEAVLQPWLRPHPEMTPTVNLVLFVYYFLVGAVNLHIALSFYFNQSMEVKQAEADRLQELDTLKTRFYTNITHEFRTPLTVILGMADQAVEKPREYFQTGLKMIRQNANRLLHLVNQMLDLSKLEGGHMPVHFIQNDILSYLRYVAEPFRHMAGEKNIRFHFLTDFDEIQMDYDPGKIESLVGNLLSNTLKHAPDGTDIFFMVAKVDGIAPPGSQLFSLFPIEKNEGNPKNLSLKIKDAGPGILPDQLDRIFDRFYQVDASNNHKPEGTGIGLALVKELVKLLGGNLFVKSAPGEGTAFTVFLPVKNEAPVSPPALAEASLENWVIHYPENGVASEKWIAHHELPHLLVIEDNRDVIQYIQAVLKGKYQINVAHNGTDGIEKALASIPDVILSDVMMPGKDGFEVCRTLKTDFRTSHIPIILLTAKADTDSRITGLEQGADAYLTKPFDSRELLVQLQKLIELREKLKVKYRQMAIGPSSAEVPAHPDDIFMNNLNDILKTKAEDESFGTNELSHTLHISRIQLFRKLKALTGHSPSELIRTYRLNKAKELLVTTTLNVSEVAFEVGFKDPAYFTKAFTKEFGYLPSALRTHQNE